MGSNNFLNLISVIVFHVFLMIPLVHGQSVSTFKNSDSLDSSIRDYALMKGKKIKTGVLYNISLPANYSGIEANVIRLRIGSLYARGANLSYFHLPQKVLPKPFSERIILVVQNLRNQSDQYYKVPNFTRVGPVLGLLAYSYGANGSGDAVELSVMNGDPISVHFPGVSELDHLAKCVWFRRSGEVEFSNVTLGMRCSAYGEGHFSIVVPSPRSQRIKKKGGSWKWWVIGFGLGIVGLFLLVMFVILLYRCVRMKKIERMERQSEKSEALDTIWVGTSRMPSAAGIRTQPVLENSYLP